MKTATRLALLLLLLALSTTAAKAEEDGPRPRFWEARLVMQKGDYASAAELFRVIVSEHPRADVADDSLYWRARCCLRLADREPDAVVALNRLLRDYPESPWLDDAARELARLGDTSLVETLKKRLEEDGPAAEAAARALTEMHVEIGLKWLREQDRQSRRAEAKTDAEQDAEKVAQKDAGPADEVAELRREVAGLKEEVDQAIALLTELLAGRSKDDDRGTQQEPEEEDDR